MVLDEPVLRCRDGPCIFAQIRKIAANEGEIGFCWINSFDAANPLNCFGLKNITTQTIDSISGINNHTAAAQTIGNLIDQSLLWIFWMYSNQHRFKYKQIEVTTVVLQPISLN